MRNNILLLLVLTAMSGCVSLISQRTDEQAWMDFQKESVRQLAIEERTPASEGGNNAPDSIKALRELTEELPFRSFLLSCETAECYQSKLVIAFDEAFRKTKDQGKELGSDDYKTEQKRFMDFYGYEQMMKWVDKFHQMLFSGVELRASSRAAELAHICESSIQNESGVQLVEFGPFAGGSTYLPRGYYSCLNAHWKNELDELLKETCERLGVVIKTAEARKWILEKQIYPIYQKTLSDWFVKKNREELADWSRELPQIEKKIDWKMPVSERISNVVPVLRKKYHFLNLEALVTELKPSKI